MQSDGTPWRPLVHIEDISRAFLGLLQAPRERVHNEAFNVGADEENYRIREVARIVEQVVPGSRVALRRGRRTRQAQLPRQLRQAAAAPSPSCTQVDGARERRGRCSPPTATTASSIADFKGSRFMRIARIKELMAEGRLDEELRWGTLTIDA